jgi:phosphoglycerol transferase
MVLQSRAFAIETTTIAILLAITTLSWCAANGKWTTADLAIPATYLNPEHADLIGTAAIIKATSEGHLRPMMWKYAPSFGAPEGADWNGMPSVEEFQFAIFGLLARFFGVFASLNLGGLIGNLSAAGSCYAVARLTGCNRTWSFVAGLTYGVSPFIFAQSPYHITCEWVWQVPLFVAVWRWNATYPGLSCTKRRFLQALAIGFVTGAQNPYFTNIFCQLTLLGGAIHAYRNRTWRPIATAAAVVGAAAIAFLLMNVDTFTYRLSHEAIPGGFVREYKWLEIYGLKIKDLFIPPINHRSDILSAFSIAHRQAAPLLDEGASYQGIFGLACLLWLVGTSVKDMIVGREQDVPVEVWWVLWIVLMFTTGGLNAIIGAFGFTLFRGACRYSIVILAITLLWAARRLSTMQETGEASSGDVATKRLWTTGAAAACMLILWDQVPRTPTAGERETIARQVDADRAFTEKMENALPPGAMVFQLPIMEFPESPAPGVPPYDHFRPYLFSKHLRYSFGSMKGRQQDVWQKELARLPSFEQIVAALKDRGFSAIYINRNGFPDRAKGIEEKLLDMGYSRPPIRNATGDLVCILLEKDGEASASGEK